jgi:hypothetical protein
MYPKIIKKLYLSSMLVYLSFSTEIMFTVLRVGEIWSLFDDTLVLSEFWTVLDAFSLSYLKSRISWNDLNGSCVKFHKLSRLLNIKDFGSL